VRKLQIFAFLAKPDPIKADFYFVNKLRLVKKLMHCIAELLFRFRPDSTCWGPLREKFAGYFSWKRFPLRLNRIASAGDSPFQKTRLFGKYTITG